MTDLFNYKRRAATVAHVGRLNIGGDNPVRVQSMTTTSTLDTEGSVAQCKRIIDAGGELVRLTTQGRREAENLANISRQLRAEGYTQPLCADIHFNANVADVAACHTEKVRINPGNYVDPARTFKHLEYTDEQYAQELEKIEERLTTFIDLCKEHHTAVRIGVNHGSLSDRIMSRYGDTPEGIVESCMEFLRIFRKHNFDDVVISIKASNTVVMVRSVRLLVAEMDREDMHYPLHLGVSTSCATSGANRDISSCRAYRPRTSTTCGRSVARRRLWDLSAAHNRPWSSCRRCKARKRELHRVRRRCAPTTSMWGNRCLTNP